ncbi:Hsp33 family molecular chaperone HslO [Sphingomonas carotinifaciens]|uniref:Hsp33 family molecular chaperone HslO n=1 Tax=Sphingomonas carotinifaciens TaxID=1166323 RepID=A0A1G7KJQ1_9SPHN|nr:MULTISPECIES: Hsp33 family molecular chaperone HslO [Sphingomonas]MBB4085292.1 molecular chaperone Hsp33 [Sphingomonas carotinifaciens]MWC43683.1 Hsp33 family molecular chaperone HslO [Sphingomonas carotinifaciens]SDF37190.1 molecular chaperone Hsp33 [Sphingomonas carotinifaciens]
MHDTTLPDFDRTLGFTIPERHARGRVVRLGPVLDTILSAHAYPPAIEALLTEALTLTALIGATLKDVDGQLTIQTRSDTGVVQLLVCDYRGGELRGYIQYDAERLAELPAEPTLFALFGQGYLAITFDLATTGERYQGIVPLDGARLADAAEAYFVQSEQIPSLVRIGVSKDADGRTVAGGLFLQHLPEGEVGRERLHVRLDHPEWDHVVALGTTIGADELTDAGVSLETLIWRLFNEEKDVRVLASTPIVRGCRCTADYIAGVIARFSVEERREMADADGMIHVDCAFCATKFPVPVEEPA